MAAAAFAQNPRPPRVIVGRLPTASVQSATVTVNTATQGAVVAVDVQGSDGVWVTCSYTVGASETTTTVATALELLIEAVTGVDSSPSTNVITVTPTVASAWFALRNPKNCSIKSTSTDTGYATALTNILAATKDFYFVTTDHNSQTIATAVAAWAQSNAREYITASNDTIEADGTGTFGSALKALGYTYSSGIFCYDTTEFPACRAAALGATRNPGSFTWHLKELIGVTPVVLTATQQANLDTEGWNYYVEVANGINGLTAKQGALAAWGGRYVDLTHGTDWLSARIKENVFSVLANAEKISYTDKDIVALKSAVLKTLREGEKNKLLVENVSTVTPTPVADANPTDKANRLYDGLSFYAEYAGAVHKVKITGTIA
jgi:hypothetical protein